MSTENLKPATLLSKDGALDPQRLRDANVLLINDIHVAVALSYELGQAPMVIASGRGRKAEDLVWCAQELGMPVVESTLLDPGDATLFKAGEEIPEHYFHSVAHVLAFLHKTQSAPGLVRFIRPITRRPRALSTRATSLVQEFGSILDIPMLYLEVGSDLLDHQAAFEEPFQSLRQRSVLELGLPIDSIPFRHNPSLPNDTYKVMFKDVAVFRGQLQPPLDAPERIFPLVKKVKQVIWQNGWELMSYHQTEALLERARKSNPGLVRQLFPKHFSIAGLRQVMRNLLREQISVRDTVVILEVILENLSLTQDPDLLTELVRLRNNRSLCTRLVDDAGHLYAIVLAVDVENELLGALREAAGVRWLEANPDMALRFLRGVGEAVKDAATLKVRCVLLVTPMLRRFLARMVSSVYADLPVLSYGEIAALTDVRSVGVVTYRTPMDSESA